MWQRVLGFVREVRVEGQKITWPGRVETVALTVLVLLMIVFFMAYLGTLETLLSAVIQRLLKA